MFHWISQSDFICITPSWVPKSFLIVVILLMNLPTIDMSSKKLGKAANKIIQFRARIFFTIFPWVNIWKDLGKLFTANLNLATRPKKLHALSIDFSGVSTSWCKLITVVYSIARFSFSRCRVFGPANRTDGRYPHPNLHKQSKDRLGQFVADSNSTPRLDLLLAK